ncbi:dihydroneopterin aldolase [Bradyrhizobium sp. AT1]|uniref:dihydroneopterin aldolase n=1 Tax=Bradyrhizobium sp. AT1 TaxID=574934 RepID=UPI0018DDCCD5|nr:dihydroneopterin aldolase [Bradyrhizobium sp. AT1]
MNIMQPDNVIVKLRNVVVEASCGIHPWEQFPQRPNKLSIDVTLFAPLDKRRLKDFGYVDYDHIRTFLKSFPSRPHTPLLETLLDEIVDQCFVDKRVEACSVSILKLNIFNETEAAGVEVFRTRAQWK